MKLNRTINRMECGGIISALVLILFAGVFVFQGIAHADASGSQINGGIYNQLCQVGIGIFAACSGSGNGTGGGGGSWNPPIDPCTIFDQYGNLPPNCTHQGGGGSGGGTGTGDGGGTGGSGGGSNGGGAGSNAGDTGGSSSAGATGGGGGGAWTGNRDAQGYFIVPGAASNGAVLGEATSTDVGTSTSESVVTSSTESTSCDVYVTAFMKFGAQNDPEQVKRMQHVLKNSEGADVDEDGVFGTTTLDAVRAFQMKYASEILAPWNISKSTGYVYLTTRKKLNEVYCDHDVTFPLTAEENKLIEKAKEGAMKPVPTIPTATGPTETPAVTPTAKVPSAPAPDSSGSSVRSFFQRLFGR